MLHRVLMWLGFSVKHPEDAVAKATAAAKKNVAQSNLKAGASEKGWICYWVDWEDISVWSFSC